MKESSYPNRVIRLHDFIYAITEDGRKYKYDGFSLIWEEIDEFPDAIAIANGMLLLKKELCEECNDS